MIVEFENFVLLALPYFQIKDEKQTYILSFLEHFCSKDSRDSEPKQLLSG